MRVLALLCCVLWASTANADQGSPCSRLTSVVVPQRSYAQLDVPAFEQRVYVYAPDIESGLGRDFKPFDLWIVEGVYGKPFVKASGAMEDTEFQRLRTSRNVRATAVPVSGKAPQKRVPVTIAKQRLVLELQVNISFGGTDRVVVNICR